MPEFIGDFNPNVLICTTGGDTLNGNSGKDKVDLKAFGLTGFSALQATGLNDGLGNSNYALGHHRHGLSLSCRAGTGRCGGGRLHADLTRCGPGISAIIPDNDTHETAASRPQA